MTQIPLILLADAEWITLAFLLVLAVIVLLSLILKKRSTDPKEPDTKSVPLPAEPDDLVIVNPTKANDPEGAVLVLIGEEGILVLVLFDFDDFVPHSGGEILGPCGRQDARKDNGGKDSFHMLK